MGSPFPGSAISSIQAANRSTSIPWTLTAPAPSGCFRLPRGSQVPHFVLEVLGELGACGREKLRAMLGRPEVVARAIVAQHLAGDRDLVHLGGAVGEAHDA